MDKVTLGLFFLLSVLLVGAICVDLAPSRTEHPRRTVLFGILLALLPPLGFIFVAVLAMQPVRVQPR
ncbi:hypothetical protein [Ferrimonas pelagia]|uniref:Cardiolipin synthase N-terminal domain-containing protein n=1 Tax=Ferrimonas pelagia TaxID=1177826 RepID=A0ABP9ET06_9GAMM